VEHVGEGPRLVLFQIHIKVDLIAN
jgi:hypothetical protein